MCKVIQFSQLVEKREREKQQEQEQDEFLTNYIKALKIYYGEIKEEF